MGLGRSGREGDKEFLIAPGDKGELIKEYFLTFLFLQHRYLG
jgi:hypothetical protein